MQYRRDIDGLRALAVVPVILYHFGVPGFSGGFVGVDIFFVISGYLITAILLKDHQAGTYSLLNFYERRARRILPALVLVILATIPAAWIILMPRDFGAFADSLVAVTLFVSNFLFWSESGYFAPAAEFKPLLHTWSLAVEEQFYIFFPILLWAVWKLLRARLMALLIVAALASFALCSWAAVYEPNANFYLLPTRAWELLIGAIAAVHMSRQGPARMSRPTAEGLGAMRLALIVISIFAFDSNTPFPSAYALLPTVGTALLLVSGPSSTWVARGLSVPVLVGIGLVSYSAYLWHQPLIALTRYRVVGDVPPLVLVVLMAATFGLAYLSWRFVEQPFRARSGPGAISARNVWCAAVGSAVVVLVAGASLDNRRSFMGRLTPEQKADYQYLDYGQRSAFANATRYGKCFLGSDIETVNAFDEATCLDTSPGRPRVLLIGDSHAAHLRQALQDEWSYADVMQMTASGCRPVRPILGDRTCVTLIRRALDAEAPRLAPDLVILSAQWQASDTDGLAAVVAELSSYAGEVVVLGPSLTLNRDLPAMMVQNLNTGVYGKWESIADPRGMETDDRIARSTEQAGGRYISMLDALCRGGLCRLRLDDGAPVIWDQSHFTLDGASYIVSKLTGEGGPLADVTAKLRDAPQR